MFEQGMPVADVFVELDCLLDTRIALISGIWPEWAERLAMSPNYFRRTDDNFLKHFPDFPQEDFQDTYRARTYAHVRGRATWTPLAKRIQTFSRIMKAKTVTLSNESPLTVTVNLYPYRVPKEDKDILEEVLLEMFAFDQVRFVNMSLDMMTPVYIDGNFKEFVIYDFDTWICHHAEALGKHPLPHVTATHPLIILKDHGLPVSKVVEQATQALRPVLDLQPLPMDTFCFKDSA